MASNELDLEKLFETDSDENRQVDFLKRVGVFASVILVAYAGFNYWTGEYTIGLLQIGLIILIAIALSHIQRTGTATFSANIAAVVLLIITLQNYITGGINQTGILWVFIFPPFIFFLTGSRKGVVWTSILYIGFISIIVLEHLGYLELPYPLFTSIMLLGALALVGVLTYTFQHSFEKAQTLSINQAKRFRKNNVSLAHEITERKFAETKMADLLEKSQTQNKQLQETKKAMLNVLEDVEEDKERLSIILHSIGDGVFVLDSQRIITLINDAACQISGHSREDLEGSPYQKYLHFLFERTKEENTGFIDEVYAKGEVTQMTNHTIIVDKSGKEIPVDDSAAPIKDSIGRTIGCVVVFRDSTREREVDRAKSEFISVASHQLRTPLTGIKWYIEMLNEKNNIANLTGEQKEMIGSIHESTERMISLVNDLLNVSRIETGRKFNIERKETDFVPIVNEVIEEANIIAQPRGIALTVKANFPDKCMLWIDGQKIKEVISNLLSNAIKYSKRDGVIEINTEDNENEFIISVKDQGVGIPEESQYRIFQKFFRASNAANETEGTGLGLYIAMNIVEGHNGRIWFQSKENEGSTFYVSLPKEKPKQKNKE